MQRCIFLKKIGCWSAEFGGLKSVNRPLLILNICNQGTFNIGKRLRRQFAIKRKTCVQGTEWQRANTLLYHPSVKVGVDKNARSEEIKLDSFDEARLRNFPTFAVQSGSIKVGKKLKTKRKRTTGSHWRLVYKNQFLSLNNSLSSLNNNLMRLIAKSSCSKRLSSILIFSCKRSDNLKFTLDFKKRRNNLHKYSFFPLFFFNVYIQRKFFSIMFNLSANFIFNSRNKFLVNFENVFFLFFCFFFWLSLIKRHSWRPQLHSNSTNWSPLKYFNSIKFWTNSVTMHAENVMLLLVSKESSRGG